MRDEQRARPGVKKRTRKPRQRLGAIGGPGGRVAGRHDHPIRVEVQLRGLRRGEQAVILLASLGRRRQQQRGLGLVLGEQRGFAREQPVGGEMNHAGAGQRAALR